MFPILVLAAISAALRAQAADPIATLQSSHPRLILPDSELERIRSLVRQDPEARAIHGRLVEKARRMETEPPIQYEKVTGRIFAKTQACIDRVYTLGILYRLERKQFYFDRAVRELRAAASFPEWTTNFLNIAEMTQCVSIGYDWLYPSLSPGDRVLLRRAIVEKGLWQALPIYEEPRHWAINVYNWNQVCNGGMGIGALAVAGDEPALSRTILDYALKSLPLAMASYGPDGAWAEGPDYWHYATHYNVLFLAALETAVGTDFGLSAIPGFNRAGHFRVWAGGPSGKWFSFADAERPIDGATEMFWLARKFREPVYAWHEHRLIDRTKSAEALDLIWYQPPGLSPSDAKWPLDARFTARGVDLVFLRSSWQDPDAIFVAVKAGQNRGGRGHAHLDLGSFVMDAGRAQWAIDLGRNAYNVPDYFGKLRFTYYRTRTESHNTILLDGSDQDTMAEAPIVEHRFTPKLAFTRVDLSAVYRGKTKRFERGVALYTRKHVIVQDEITATQPLEALWGMVTDAEISGSGSNIELRKGDWALSAKILTPAGARFDTVSTQVPPPQTQNSDTRKLVVRLPGKITDLRLVVALTPHPKSQPPPPNDWKDRLLERW